ncbi:MAG: arginyltransferase [Planctomycetaceae bacterium]|nr:arginyltransferase [Planctomycetaceae bacterium]
MQHELPFSTDLEVERNTLACPYLPDRVASLVYWLPHGGTRAKDLDRRLEAGQRRHGPLVYEPQCQGCQECISLRIPVESFQPSRSQRRVWTRGQKKIVARVGVPIRDQARLELINRHSGWRGWLENEENITEDFYEQVFVCSLFHSLEIAYYVDTVLVGIAICDRGEVGFSAVYTYYDPAYAELSIGTYSILYQLEYCRRVGLRYLYLGYYVAECPSLMYKANFGPHQRRLGGQWIDMGRDEKETRQ